MVIWPFSGLVVDFLMVLFFKEQKLRKGASAAVDFSGHSSCRKVFENHRIEVREIFGQRSPPSVLEHRAFLILSAAHRDRYNCGE